jgi:hypothetical protein
MSRRSPIRLLLALAALALLAVPAAASASWDGLPLPQLPGLAPQVRAALQSRLDSIGTPAEIDAPRGLSHMVEVKASKGYEAQLFAFGNEVVLEVVHGEVPAITAYVVRGNVSPRRLRADFGEFGKIDLRFHPSKGRSAVHPHDFCRGAPRELEHDGVYTGIAQFEGEGGYISINAHRATGSVTTEGLPCGRRHRHAHRHASAASSSLRDAFGEPSRPRALFASWRHAVDSAEFGSFTFFGKTLTIAMSGQSEGRMAILHLALDIAPLRIFALNDALTSAKLSPQKPFHGTGLYTAAPDGTSTWDGSLTVNYPGAPAFPLTGAPFEAEVAAGL